jgi:transcriptional regulator with XRE-family HTH domain
MRGFYWQNGFVEVAEFAQEELATKLNLRRLTLSNIENGKIEIGILTLVQISRIFHKPISYFIPEMKFLENLTDIENKREEEALSHFKEIEMYGDERFTLDLLKMLSEYYFDKFQDMVENDDMFIPDEEDL